MQEEVQQDFKIAVLQALYYKERRNTIMANGRVKWFNEKKGFGFIESAEHGDVFVHYTAIEQKGFRSLSDGDEVTFEVEQGSKGLQAVKVKTK
jgi:cold shock protein